MFKAFKEAEAAFKAQPHEMIHVQENQERAYRLWTQGNILGRKIADALTEKRKYNTDIGLSDTMTTMGVSFNDITIEDLIGRPVQAKDRALHDYVATLYFGRQKTKHSPRGEGAMSVMDITIHHRLSTNVLVHHIFLFVDSQVVRLNASGKKGDFVGVDLTHGTDRKLIKQALRFVEGNQEHRSSV